MASASFSLVRKMVCAATPKTVRAQRCRRDGGSLPVALDQADDELQITTAAATARDAPTYRGQKEENGSVETLPIAELGERSWSYYGAPVIV